MAVDKIDPYGFKEWENNFFDWDIELNQKKTKNIIDLEDPYGF